MAIVRIDQYTSDGRLRTGHDSWGIYAAFAPTGDGMVLTKIGISTRPLKRAYEIHCGSPFPLEVVLWSWVGTKRQARSVEKTIHNRLTEKRTRGEWFEFNTSSAEDKALFHSVAKAAYARATARPLKWTKATIEQVKEAAGIDWKSMTA